jgi:hypothetical protein
MWDTASPLIMLVPRGRLGHPEKFSDQEIGLWKLGLIDYSKVGNPIEQYKAMESDYIAICLIEVWSWPWDKLDAVFLIYFEAISSGAEKWIGSKDGRALIKSCAWLFCSDIFW